ncbi:MAG: L-aspartate oxidase [Oscillospiraceae bacterium]|nr:L-aspartate oxidase [Oscillospiraceae bacterium]MDD4413483.1 L-aspartate oxidase [Oscillospiraceae bacterium]
MNEYDVLIAGSGVAGLYAALNFAPEVRVLVISKRELTLCNSFLAQGGIAAVIDKTNDDYRLHIADTLIAGRYKNDLRSLEILVNEGPEDVRRLGKELGVDFDRDETRNISMTLEGGHSRRRILHHKDSTGREITEKLLSAAKSRPNIDFLENTCLASLTPANGGFWAGLLINGEHRYLSCSYCILCTGGIGRVYPYTTNSAIATGDGITLAYELGARIKNLHFVQFHPTAFAAKHGRERFLISEAVRGEGAVLLNCKGERFMQNYDERGELAPRDVVSQSIIKESIRTDSEDFYLDITHRGEDFIRQRFPMIYEHCLEEGVDITRDRIPVFPCQHYLMGGIDVNVYGDTTVDRLYAAGECSHTGVHGLNRLASNSLLEALVFARRCTYDISRRMRHEDSGVTTPQPPAPSGKRVLAGGHRTAIRRIMQRAWFVIPDFDAVQEGLIEARAILEDLRSDDYVLTLDYIEAKSIATVCTVLLNEVVEKEINKVEI